MLGAHAIEDLEEIVAALKRTYGFSVALISHRVEYSLLVTLLPRPKRLDGSIGNLAHIVHGRVQL